MFSFPLQPLLFLYGYTYTFWIPNIRCILSGPAPCSHERKAGKRMGERISELGI
jgi:hypothetical protein